MYSPAITDQATIALRRLAWAIGKPMTKTASALIENVLSFVDPAAICAKCRDTSKCEDCFFSGAKINGARALFQPISLQTQISKEVSPMKPTQVSVLISKKVGKDFCSWSVSHGVTASLENDDDFESAIEALDATLKSMVSQSLPLGPAHTLGQPKQAAIATGTAGDAANGN